MVKRPNRWILDQDFPNARGITFQGRRNQNPRSKKSGKGEQIQAIRNADGIAALFATLGYATAETRLPQAPEALGITAESTVGHIRSIERIAEQDGLLSIYLFEVHSLTQGLIHRNFKGVVS
ncbi:MAG: hypothetical protein D6704_12925 [Nitrospirae bacterium]|nr:MAG: hypothetical protein D6704_12925 [Nitrospirota bacterium]